MSTPARIPRRFLAAWAAVIATSSGTIAVSALPAAAAAEPPLRLVPAAPSITITHAAGELIWFESGVHVVAGEQPFEIWAQRSSYAAPIRAQRTYGKRVEPLPDGLVSSFAGLPRFTHVTLKNQAGATVLERDEDFCPNNGAVRTQPDAPASSPYPEGCSSNPFALGAVWGIQRRWGVPAGSPWWHREPAQLPDGTYTAEVRINTPYIRTFGIPAAHASVSVAVAVRTVAGEPPVERRRLGRESLSRRRAQGGRPAPAAVAAPTGVREVPQAQRPDLRALPAWSVRIGDDGAAGGRDRLWFNATVWTAGRSRLVVEGFRRTDHDVMDAYQYFYDENGKQTGHARIGTMEWDDRDGHQGWQYADFAAYRLLDARRRPVATIAADAACLADTDAVDYAIEFASWQPWTVEPHAVCGDRNALATRAVLNVGSGFTQAQFMPGQTFDITDRANGTYYLQVLANPHGRLFETDTTNNDSLRKIVLGGRPGARTVDVPPHQGIAG